MKHSGGCLFLAGDDLPGKQPPITAPNQTTRLATGSDAQTPWQPVRDRREIGGTGQVVKPTTCGVCGAAFQSRSRPGRDGGWSKFCSVACGRENRKREIAARTELECKTCKQVKPVDQFLRNQGGEKKWVRHCRECRNGEISAERRLRLGVDSTCPVCGSIFRAAKQGADFNKYCSRICANAALETVPKAACRNCGLEIKKTRWANGSERQYCSMKCRAGHAVGPNSQSWKGGVRPNGHMVAYVGQREGYASTSWAVHRIVASDAIGRTLHKWEVVLHIDNDPQNNHPSNLFICESIGEFRRRLLGKTMQWPEKSNLETYEPTPSRARVLEDKPC